MGPQLDVRLGFYIIYAFYRVLLVLCNYGVIVKSSELYYAKCIVVLDFLIRRTVMKKWFACLAVAGLFYSSGVGVSHAESWYPS